MDYMNENSGYYGDNNNYKAYIFPSGKYKIIIINIFIYNIVKNKLLYL